MKLPGQYETKTITCPECLLQQTGNAKSTRTTKNFIIYDYTCVKCRHEWSPQTKIYVNDGKYRTKH